MLPETVAAEACMMPIIPTPLGLTGACSVQGCYLANILLSPIDIISAVDIMKTEFDPGLETLLDMDGYILDQTAIG